MGGGGLGWHSRLKVLLRQMPDLQMSCALCEEPPEGAVCCFIESNDLASLGGSFQLIRMEPNHVAS